MNRQVYKTVTFPSGYATVVFDQCQGCHALLVPTHREEQKVHDKFHADLSKED